jgi:hypothetical protein
LRRLFSTFATGLPGLGLLVLRVATGSAIGFQQMGQVPGNLPVLQGGLPVFKACLAFLMLAGLWTPLAGMTSALFELASMAWSKNEVWTHGLLASLGVTLALVGPGGWSLDARLFGRRRIDIPERRTTVKPPENV